MITYNALGRNGNTGNSLFQYCTLISLAKSKGYEVKIPDYPSYYDVNYQCNNYSIRDGFDIDTPVCDPSELKHLATYTEQSFAFDPAVLELPDNVNLNGYFQSEKYFVHNRRYILDTLQFKTEIKTAAKELFNTLNIAPERTTSIHVRRGDFIHKQAFHPLVTPAYYTTATGMTRTPKYLVFSDDIPWCKEAFGINGNVYYSENKNPFVDMCAMSMCAHNIIVNSTFSWWGAWLNTNPGRLVIAPKQWLGPAYQPPYAAPGQWDTKDVIPDGWFQI